MHKAVLEINEGFGGQTEYLIYLPAAEEWWTRIDSYMELELNKTPSLLPHGKYRAVGLQSPYRRSIHINHQVQLWRGGVQSRHLPLE